MSCDFQRGGRVICPGVLWRKRHANTPTQKETAFCTYETDVYDN